MGANIPDFLRNLLSMRGIGDGGGMVLVGHNISAEIDILRNLGIDLLDPIYPIIGVLNTYRIARSEGVTSGFQGPSLGGLVRYLEIPQRRSFFHNSGNDAHLTMRCLLALAARAFERLETSHTLRHVQNSKNLALCLLFQNRDPRQGILS